MLIVLRELVVRIPYIAPPNLGERLADGLKQFKYTVERSAPYNYVCKPTRGLARRWGYGQLQVAVHRGGVDLIGPATLVNRVKKHLLAAR